MDGRDPRNVTRRAAALILLGGIAAASACQGEGSPEGEAGASAAARDSAALLADRVMETLGGAEAWEETRYVAFHWIVARDGQPVRDRAHAWDRYDGRYRLEYEADDGRFLALFNVNEVARDSAIGKVPAGRVWVDGAPLEGTARDSALARAYAIFINDSYWLLMPFKWHDPGVHLDYAGRRTLEDGTECEVVHLTFEQGLGVTEDQYWGFVDPETGRMVAWQYHLQNRDEPGAVIRWEGWRPVGPIQLATDRIWPDGSRNIYFEGLEASQEVPEGAFEPPPDLTR